jgi:hypothetical protein
MSKAKPKRNPKTGRYEKFNAPDNRGIPGGWSVNPDSKSTKSKSDKPIIIKHDNSVKPDTAYLANARAMLGMAKRLLKDGAAPVISPRIKAALAAEAKAEKTASRRKSKKKDNDSE